MKNISHKIAFIIGFAFPMYGYAIIGKEYFDLCTDVFIATLIFLLLDFIIMFTKDKAYIGLCLVALLSVMYAIIKEILGLGTENVFTDKIMWVLIPLLLVIIPIVEIINTFKNNDK